jgi:hypothetical protein
VWKSAAHENILTAPCHSHQIALQSRTLLDGVDGEPNHLIVQRRLLGGV